ncbi:hypothetical protein QLS71_011770 [Mariniflexile litorale]|uniref:Uncharacterized protein n=1 Tax=Mariniflexile litorale TaxID=3045158 RepID=A0AAU7EBK1_9FLAO|nr:hypothetical protein [Mariniflexile sp. KMM 9835]MDQ8213027.1 hypothetical protein [Mariniflexile sp. KMM 9835]
MNNSFAQEQKYYHGLAQVEIFKTDIKNQYQANFFKSELLKIFCDLKIDFDLEDCDKILRVEGGFECDELFEIAKKLNIKIEVLKD